MREGAALKKELMNKGIPEMVANRLADRGNWLIVRGLNVAKITEIAYGYSGQRMAKEKDLKKKRELREKSRIIFYLINPDSRNIPEVPIYPSPKATYGILNWWWNKDSDKNQTPNLIQRFRDLHELSKVELRVKTNHAPIGKAITQTEKKSPLVAQVMKEELESNKW